MNIVNVILLRLVLLPWKLYEKFGINTVQLHAILSTKLLMDDRRPNTFQQASHKHKNKDTARATLYTMFLSVLLGAFFILSFSIGTNLVTQLTFFFSMFIFMLASTLISD